MAKAAPNYRVSHDNSSVICRAVLRTLQFIFALIVATLYGIDLHHATSLRAPGPASWIYAEVVAGLSMLYCAIHCFMNLKSRMWMILDWVLAVMWAAQFGVFATIFLGPIDQKDAAMTTSLSRMRAGVWVDMINMILWLMSALWSAAWCCCCHRRSSRTVQPSEEDQVLAWQEERRPSTEGRVSIASKEYSSSKKDTDALVSADEDVPDEDLPAYTAKDPTALPTTSSDRYSQEPLKSVKLGP